jgi:ParB/RepB/Spo0J family partition protein
MTIVIDVAPSQIRPSPFNHRKKFSGLDELGASLLAKGMISPLTVRPAPKGKDDEYELVVGERRWRAATKIKLDKVPAIVRELNDKEVIEIQLIENVQRVDVHPMEEAEGYSELMTKHGYDVDMIVAKTGKSHTAVYNRLKLLKLAPAARKAFLEDKFNASIAEMIARIPSAELQGQATAEILKGRHEDRWSLNADEDEDEVPREALQATEEEVLPLTFREAQLLLQRRYMLRLELAPFDPADDKLVPSVGACTKCIYRTGNQPDLFGDVPSADVCTNPPCFESKKKADWDRKAAAAKEAGRTVLAGEQAEKIFGYGRLTWNAPYFDLKAEADHEFQPAKGKKKTWGEVLGKDAPTVTLARDDGGAAHELVAKTEAFEALKRANKLPKHLAENERSEEASRASRKASQAKEKKRQRVKQRTAELAIAEILTRADSTKLDLTAWRWIAECVVRGASMEAHQATCDRRGIEPVKVGQYGGTRAPREEALLKFVRALDGKNDAPVLSGLVLELLAWEQAAPTYADGYGKNLEAAAKAFGFTLAKLRDKAVKELESDGKPAKPASTPGVCGNPARHGAPCNLATGKKSAPKKAKSAKKGGGRE